MITIPVIHTCSYVPSSNGTLFMTHPVIKTLAGAVWDKEEWLALLLGTRSKDGLKVNVTALRIPRQYRNYSACDTVEEESLTPDVVGVVHSHHSMGAFFSNTDHKTLNTRFPLSIVIAQLKNDSQAERLFGFSYKAEGKVMLPCNKLGSIPFRLSPSPLPTWWPEVLKTGFQKPQTVDKCELMTGVVHGLTTTFRAPCGLSTERPTTSFFGQDGDSFIKEVESKTSSEPKHYTQQVAVGQAIQVGPPNLIKQVRDQYDFLTSWNWVD